MATTLRQTRTPYQHGGRWHVDYADGTLVNRVSFDKEPDQKTIDAALLSVAADLDADAARAAIEAQKEADWQAWLVKQSVASVEELRAKVLANPKLVPTPSGPTGVGTEPISEKP